MQHKNTHRGVAEWHRCSAMSITPRRAVTPVRCESALFPDNVPISVYDNLIESVHRNLPAVYRYYELRRRKMKLEGAFIITTPTSRS